MSITTTTYAPLLKRIYTPKQVQYLAFKKRPFLGLVKKNTKNFGGAAYSFSVEYGRNPGRSRKFTTAQTNAGGTKSANFLVTRVHDYGVARIENEAILASMGKKAAFMPALKNTMERTIDGVSFQLSKDIWGNGGGSLGRIASGSTTDTITLYNKEDAINFYAGQVIETSTTDGTDGAGALSTGSATGEVVESVDYDAGTVTCTSATWDAVITGIADDDYLFQQGDFNTTGALKISGVQAWCPPTAPGATSFFNVNRSVAVNDLGGLRPVVTGASTIHEKLIRACGSAARFNAETDHIFLNPEDVTTLDLELENKAVYVKSVSPKQKDIAQVSFDAIRINTPMGAVDVLSDQHCPKGRAYGLNMASWELGSLGGAPIVLAQGDDIFVYNADSKEIRVGYYANLYCTAPGKNWTCAI